MTIEPANGLGDQARRLAVKRDLARERLRSNLSLARDILIGVLVLAGVGAVFSIGSSGLNLIAMR